MKLRLNLAAKLAGLILTLTTVATQAAGAFGDLPLFFETSSPASFTAQGRDAQFSVSATHAQITLQKSGVTRIVQMQLTGANAAPAIQGDGGLAGKINYLTGSQPAQWRVGVPTFARVQVSEIYPGINLVYYGNQQRLEYDFTVASGANPKAIAMHFTGADKISVNLQGELVLKLGRDEMIQPRPEIYQTVNGARQEISGGYRILAANDVAFTVGNYDHNLPLVIDPVLDYSTYFGGTLMDTGWAIAVDKTKTNSSVFIAGQTLSKKAINNTKNPTDFTKGAPFSTPGAFQEEFADGKITGDGFVACFDSTGTNLIYLTYLGGDGDDFVSSVAVDAAGNAFVTGFTDSSNFPTVNALYPKIGGIKNKRTKAYSGDAFVAELNPSGSNLVFSTYLGGSELDVANGIALDASGNIYVAGTTSSTNFPILNPVAFQLIGSTNPLLNQLAGTNNAFVTKLGAGGSNLVYSTYLGGFIYDVAEGITVDASNSVIVAGFTISSNYPTLNAISSEINEGGDKKNNDYKNQNKKNKSRTIAYDAFVTKLSPAGNSLVYSTFLGSTNNDVAYRIASDSAGDAFVTGYTASPNFPYTVTNIPGFYSIVASNKNGSANNVNGEADVFLTKFDPSGALVYSAMFGGKKSDIGYGVAADAAGNAFVVGTTFSKDFPTNNAITRLRNYNSGTSDIFVTGLNSNATALFYSGYLGGKKNDNGYGIAIDAVDSVYIVGQTSSKDFPATNSFQPFRNGKGDAILSKISLP